MVSIAAGSIYEEVLVFSYKKVTAFGVLVHF